MDIINAVPYTFSLYLYLFVDQVQPISGWGYKSESREKNFRVKMCYFELKNEIFVFKMESSSREWGFSKEISK